MQPIKVTTLSACIAAIGFVPAVYAADNSTVILDTITVKGTRNKDEIGKNRVYTREIVNLYKSKNEVETFKGNTVSDLLSGMSGVYSGDARNSGALDPNIRGVQGQGRIPVTIDGTEQAITVWRGYAGANNRNYVDPNIISSVSIEKGPSFSRDMKSGIGGSVALKTIDADDIVPEGQKYGFEVKAEASNNSIKQRANVYEKSVDYRTLDAPAVALGGICGRCWTIPTASASVSADAIDLGRIKLTALLPPPSRTISMPCLPTPTAVKAIIFPVKKVQSATAISVLGRWKRSMN